MGAPWPDDDGAFERAVAAAPDIGDAVPLADLAISFERMPDTEEHLRRLERRVEAAKKRRQEREAAALRDGSPSASVHVAQHVDFATLDDGAHDASALEDAPELDEEGQPLVSGGADDAQARVRAEYLAPAASRVENSCIPRYCVLL